MLRRPEERIHSIQYDAAGDVLRALHSYLALHCIVGHSIVLQA